MFTTSMMQHLVFQKLREQSNKETGLNLTHSVIMALYQGMSLVMIEIKVTPDPKRYKLYTVHDSNVPKCCQSSTTND